MSVNGAIVQNEDNAMASKENEEGCIMVSYGRNIEK